MVVSNLASHHSMCGCTLRRPVAVRFPQLEGSQHATWPPQVIVSRFQQTTVPSAVTEMAAPPSPATSCGVIETESEENQCEVPPLPPVSPIATESESSTLSEGGRGGGRTRQRKVDKRPAHALGRAPSPAVEIQTDSGSPSAAEGEVHRKRQRRKGPTHTQAPSSSSEDPDRHSGLEKQPESSGCFDFVTWLATERLSHAELDTISRKFPLRLGSMCSGMATEELALAAIHDALVVKDFFVQPHVSAFKAECDPQKVRFLRERLPDTPIFVDNGCLANAMPETVDGKCVQRPRCDILVCGLVCKDISGLSRTPKPISGTGKSGQALQGLLSALNDMPFEERPRLVTLECVARLGSSRHVDQADGRGTEFVSNALRKLGYVGTWFTVKPRHFFLPQSRARVYSIHLKVKDFSEDCVAARKALHVNNWNLKSN